MLASPWDLGLTIAFLFTGSVCLGGLLARRRGAAISGRDFWSAGLVDVNHAVMSAAMILMSWVIVSDALTWAQVVLFTLLTLALTADLRFSQSAAQRLSLLGHIALNSAMVWMLAAMPLIMAGADLGHAAHTDHAHGGHDGALASSPGWVVVVNIGFLALCAAGALWWLYRLTAGRRHRLHALCHAVMAAGMAVMLLLMAG